MVLLYCGRVGRRRVFITKKPIPQQDGLSRFYSLLQSPIAVLVSQPLLLFTSLTPL